MEFSFDGGFVGKTTFSSYVSTFPVAHFLLRRLQMLLQGLLIFCVILISYPTEIVCNKGKVYEEGLKFDIEL